jgi:phage tail-like protein
MANEHFNVSNFVVNIDGLKSSQFTEVSGLEVSIEALPYQEGAMAVQKARKGRTRVADIALKRRFNGDKEFANWIKECSEGETVKRSGSIILNDDTGSEVLRFNFSNAWPVSWRPPVLTTRQANEVSYEEVVLNVETMEIA